MKKSLLFILLSVFLTACGKDVEYTRKTIKNELNFPEKNIFYANGKEIATQIYGNDFKVKKTIGKVPNGKIKEYSKSNKLLWEYSYKNGKLNGVSRMYNPRGKIYREEEYKDGIMHGTLKGYYPTGEIDFIGNIKNGKQDGIFKKYDKNGNLINTQIYKDNKLSETK